MTEYSIEQHHVEQPGMNPSLAVDNLQLRLRHIGVEIGQIEAIGDYLLGLCASSVDSGVVAQPEVRELLENFATKYLDHEVGYKAAMLTS